MNGIEQQHLTIIGDRQHGKSHALMRLAIAEAQIGNRVYYQCQSASDVSCRLHDLQNAIPMQGVSRFVLTRGEQSVEFMSGGVIAFFAPPTCYPVAKIDLHVIDDVSHAEPWPGAKRVVRAVLR